MNDNRLWIIGAALAMVVVLVLGWVVGISPKLAEAAQAGIEQAGVDALNAKEEAVLVVLREQVANLDQLEEDLDELRAQIPGEALIEDFIDFAKASADASGVVITSVMSAQTDAAPAPPASAPGAPAAPAADPAAPTGPELFVVPVTVVVEGEPAAVLAFSRLLQEGERIFLAGRVDIASILAGAPGGTVTGYVFVLRGVEVAEAPVE